MSDRQQAMIVSWIEDNKFLIDGILLHRGTSALIAEWFRESEMGRAWIDYVDGDAMHAAMIHSGYIPNSSNSDTSYKLDLREERNYLMGIIQHIAYGNWIVTSKIRAEIEAVL
jgi:hypothetical protein